MAPPDAISKNCPVRRQACNRCHAAKLRCIRSPKSQQCARCIKAGAECVHDPPHRLGRPRVNNLPPPNPISPAPIQRQDTNFNSSIAESCWSSQDSDLIHTTSTSSGCLLNAATEDATVENGKNANSRRQDPHHVELEFLAASQSHQTALEFDIDFCPSGDQPIQTDESCFFTNLLTPGPNLEFSLSPPQSMESIGTCHDYRNPGYSNPAAMPISSSDPAPLPSPAEEKSDPGSKSEEIPSENLVLVLSRLIAELHKCSCELTCAKQAQSSLAFDKQTGQLPIPGDFFKSQLRANIEASEQMLEALSRINNQSRLSFPGLKRSWQPDTSNLSERDRLRGIPTSSPQQRDRQSGPGSYFTMEEDYNGLESPLTDPQDSITSMLLISIYMRLLHNFDILVSIMYMHLKESGSITHNSDSSTSSLAVSAHENELTYNPALQVSMGSCSFSSPSAASLQVLFNVQLINTLLAKMKVSIQRMASLSKIPGSFGMDHNSSNSAFSNGSQYSVPSATALGSHYSHHKARHAGQLNSSHEVPRAASGSFGAGVYRVVEGALEEIERMDSNLHSRADSIQRWTIEMT